jgi:outer membrane protein
MTSARPFAPCLLLFAIAVTCATAICQSTPADVNVGQEVKPDKEVALSLQEAIRMALENNLDIQLEQLDQSVANFSITRTKGGATPRLINYNIAETPAGALIGPIPLLYSTTSTLSPNGIQPSGIAIPSSYDVGHVLEAQHSLSLATAPFSAGTPVPAYDLNLLGQYGWIRRDPSNSIVTSGTATSADTTITNNTLGNTTAVKGFSTGTSIQLGINNFVQSFYSGRSSAVPFTHPNAIALIAQPLLRGAGRTTNTRYIAIAKTNKNISAAILEQQMISTVSGVESLYYDLVSLQNTVKVQQQALNAANDLLSNSQQQLNVGRMPPIEVARAEALVAASQLGLAQAIALREQQANVLRTVIDPQSLITPNVKLVEIVATEDLSPPPEATQAPLADLIQHALEQRPDVKQSKLQIVNGERAVAGSANARLPQIDLYGSFQSRGVVSPSLIPVGGDPTTGAPILDLIPAGGIRASMVSEAGIQFNLPVQNRVAEADLGADRAQLQQERLRLIQMEAQVAAEVRNAVIGLNAARQAMQSAATARHLQKQLLSAEAEKFRAGYSTNFAVIEQQTYLTQAETTEIAAQAAWQKATVQLDRALGNTLTRHGIDIDSDSTRTKVPHQ